MKYLIALLLISCTFAQINFDTGVGIEVADLEDYVTNDYRGYQLSHTELGNVMFLTQLRLGYKNFDVILDTKLYTKLEGTFSPSLAIFDSEVGYNLKKFRVALAHRCAHPVITLSDTKSIKVSGGYDFKLKLHYNVK